MSRNCNFLACYNFGPTAHKILPFSGCVSAEKAKNTHFGPISPLSHPLLWGVAGLLRAENGSKRRFQDPWPPKKCSLGSLDGVRGAGIFSDRRIEGCGAVLLPGVGFYTGSGRQAPYTQISALTDTVRGIFQHQRPCMVRRTHDRSFGVPPYGCEALSKSCEGVEQRCGTTAGQYPVIFGPPGSPAFMFASCHWL